MVLSRRVSNPDGSFGGIALIAIDLEYFRQVFAELSLGQHGSMSLIGNDGIMVMRHPYDVHIIGRNISKAATFRRFQTAGGFFFGNGVDRWGRRLYYFKHLPKLPLIIMVAEAEQDIYAGCWHRAVMIGALVATFGVAIIVVSIMLSTQLRPRMRAESERVLLARTDGFTGLNNRRSFGGSAGPRMARVRRANSVFSLLFVDVDRFKAYNDTYGHQGGRRRTGGCCSLHRREYPTPGRYRGSLRRGRIRCAVARYAGNGCCADCRAHSCGFDELALKHAGSEYRRVTASIGLASWTPEQEEDAGAVIKAADEAPYYAKATGRNKVAAFQSRSDRGHLDLPLFFARVGIRVRG
ncbi:sensor domain-containing diguanylate cyclase [Burkholderia cepacia]|uniref:sensor domain-containing diguanylate cyclase n=1 Tax=Burkholderia cepacia TaxID=292 RepID=UPI003C7D0ABE